MRLTGGQAFELGRADATVNAHDTASRLPPITDFIGGNGHSIFETRQHRPSNRPDWHVGLGPVRQLVGDAKLLWRPLIGHLDLASEVDRGRVISFHG